MQKLRWSGGVVVVMYVLKGGDLHFLVWIGPAGQIGLDVLIRQCQEHILLGEEFFKVGIHGDAESGERHVRPGSCGGAERCLPSHYGICASISGLVALPGQHMYPTPN